MNMKVDNNFNFLTKVNKCFQRVKGIKYHSKSGDVFFFFFFF